MFYEKRIEALETLMKMDHSYSFYVQIVKQYSENQNEWTYNRPLKAVFHGIMNMVYSKGLVKMSLPLYMPFAPIS